MNKKNKIRVAIVVTLSVVAIVLGVIAFQPQNETQGATDITPVRTPDVVTFELVVTPSPTPPPMPTKSPVQSDEGSSVEVAIGHIRIGRSIRIPKINVIRYLIQTNNDTSNNTAI